MRLIYIVNARIPNERAHGIQIMKMCEAFAKAGINIELVLPRRFNSMKDDPFAYYQIDKVFQIKKLPCLDFIILDKYLGHLGLWIESSTFFFSTIFYLFFRKVDLIYTRDKLLLPFCFFKKNLIFEVHTFPQKYFLYSFYLKRLKKLVVITQKLKDLFVERGMTPSKILVAPDGVDLTQFDIKITQEECREKLGLSQEKRIVLYAGHLYQWKGAAVLLEAVRKIQDVLFIFVGGTQEDVADFKKQAENLNNVLIVGHKPYQEIPYWLRAADVLCLPNSGQEDISKYWTSPMKLFEYMAAKKPIVASNLSSIREILNEENAVLVEPDNPEALALGIKNILQSPQLSNEISDKAFKDVKEYSWGKRAKNILNFIAL